MPIQCSNQCSIRGADDRPFQSALVSAELFPEQCAVFAALGATDEHAFKPAHRPAQQPAVNVSLSTAILVSFGAAVGATQCETEYSALHSALSSANGFSLRAAQQRSKYSAFRAAFC